MIKDCPKILIISFASSARYFAPSWPRIFNELCSLPGCVAAGYGFPESSASIAALEKRHGKFDAIIAEPWIYANRDKLGWSESVPVDIRECGIPVLLSLMGVDVHSGLKEFFTDWIDKADAAFSPVASRQFLPEFPLERARDEAWFDETQFPVQNPHIFENFHFIPHCVGENEFRPRAWKKRNIDISLLGATYQPRKMAKQRLAEKWPEVDVECLDGFLTRALRFAVGRGQIYEWVTPFNRFYQQRFRSALERSKASITCDGSVSFAHRKFFEIPAAGAALIGRFFNEPEALGFLHGENCWSFDETNPDSLDSIVKWLLSDSKEVAVMANSGREMVLNFHTTSKRVSQILEIVNRLIHDQTPLRSRWESGNMILS